jgi:MFS family permease
MAVGMIVSSPIAGAWGDRHGSRALAAAGMLLSAVALAGMTMLGVHTSY